MKVARVSAVAFLLVALAAVGGLVVTQKLRRSDPVVLGVRRTQAFSPVGSGPRAASLSFWLKRADRVAVSVVDSRGDVVRPLAVAASVPARRRVVFSWDGKSPSGARLPDGIYRFRVGLAAQGRSLTLPQRVRLDTGPARPWIARVQPSRPGGPLLLTGAGRAVGIVRGSAGRDVVGWVVRVNGSRGRVVVRLPLAEGARRVPWNGTIGGRPAPDGIYMIGLDETDKAGNRGSFPASLDPLPSAVRGRPGVTVRRLAASSPQLPHRPGGVLDLPVAAAGGRWKWALRQAGSGRVLASGRGRGDRIRLRLPRRRSGLFLVAVNGGGRRLIVPVPVNRRPRPLLVVLPTIRWQGTSAVDENGDGLPDTLPLGRAVTLGRLAPPRIALEGLQSQVIPLLKMLALIKVPYELTTDSALAQGRGPSLRGHSGAVIAGESTWLPEATLAGIRRWIEGGGRLLDLSLDGMRRTVTISRGVAARPSGPRAAGPAGGVNGSGQQGAAFLSAWKDEIGLFDDTGGRVFAPAGAIPTREILKPGRLVAAAGVEAGLTAVAAWRLGRGLNIRPGIPDLAALAESGRSSSGLLARALVITAGGKR